MTPLFHVVLHEPLIPNNTGNIGRTCVATGCALHLIRPLGFDTDEKACRRAGLDYWPRLDVREHADFESYWLDQRPERVWAFSTAGVRPVFDADLRPGDHLLFGKETHGLPDDLRRRFADTLLTLPMVPGERSLNLSVAVGVAVYEGLRRALSRGEARLSARGRVLSGGAAADGPACPPARYTPA